MDRTPVEVTSYANIALIKYWGKANAEKMIPSTSSISITLENLSTRTRLSENLENTEDVFYINGHVQSRLEQEKVSRVLDMFQKENRSPMRVETWNSMPTAAGLSSSSSGLSALVKAASLFYQSHHPLDELAQLAKFASGSSARSFYGPVTAWDKHSGAIFSVKTNLKLAMLILVLNDQQKPISSREGMRRTVASSSCFQDWVEQSEKDYQDMLVLLAQDDFEKIGLLAQKNALAMHRTTRYAQPSFSYLTSESYQAIARVEELQKQGYRCYFTMDAGPNVKVLCLEEDLAFLTTHFAKYYRVIPSKTKELP